MAHNNDCPEPSSLWDRIRQFFWQVLNNVAVRVMTLIATGVIVATGGINHAVAWIIQMFTQVFPSMPPIANLPLQN